MAPHAQSSPEGDIWTRLAASLPPEVIRTRVERNQRTGQELTFRYIDAVFVAERLDQEAPGRWDLKLGELQVQRIPRRDKNDLIIFHVKASLFISDDEGRVVVRDDYGTGNSPKAAASDAFKRAAVRFGIGRELYDKDVKAELRAQGQAYIPPAVRQGPVGVPPAPAQQGATATESPSCPVCGGPMWDDRATKRNPRAPDFKCRNKPQYQGGPGCPGVIWPPRDAAPAGNSPKGGAEDRDALARVQQEEEAFQNSLTGHLDDEEDDLPF